MNLRARIPSQDSRGDCSKRLKGKTHLPLTTKTIISVGSCCTAFYMEMKGELQEMMFVVEGNSRAFITVRSILRYLIL